MNRRSGRVQELEGTVTEVNETLCMLKCATKYHEVYVHLAVVASVKSLTSPLLGSYIIIRHFEVVVVVNGTRQIHCFCTKDSKILQFEDGSTNMSLGKLPKLVREHNLTTKELFTFYFRFPSVMLDTLCAESTDEIKLMILTYLLEVESKRVIVPTLSTPATIEYVERNKIYPGFPAFTLGTQHNRHNEYLIGYLVVHNLKQFKLTDGKQDVLARIYSRCKDALRNIVNRVVVIRKFLCLTETHQDGVNLYCILCDVNDVHVLDCNLLQRGNEIVLLQSELPANLKYVNELKVCIINVAQPNSTARRTLEAWMEVLMLVEGKTWAVTFLCVEQPHFNILPLLEIGTVYSIYLTRSLMNYTDPEIRRQTNSNRLHKICAGSGIFVKRPDIECPKAANMRIKVLTLPEVSKLLKNYTGQRTYANFEGTITLKIFTKADTRSRTKPEIKTSDFGTPDKTKSHVLRFELLSDKVTFSLYLNNWERKICPFGLIPNVRVIVRHAEIAKNYCRSNMMTTFETVGYDSPIIFNTVNLNSAISRIYYANLGDGHHIPIQALVQARSLIRNVKQFKIHYTEHEGLTVIALFFTTDDKGEAFTICKIDLILKYLLFDGEDSLFDKWYEAFKNVQSVWLYEENALWKMLPKEERFFHTCALQWLKSIFEKTMITVEWVARRIEPKNQMDNGGAPLWLVTDVLDVIS